MKGKYTTLLIAGMLMTGLLQAQTYSTTSRVSEETEPAFCPTGYAASGIRCTGQYCDEIALTCAKYTDGGQTHRAPHRWSSKTISEEALGDAQAGWSIAPGDPNSFITGIKCSGDYCDNVLVDLDAPDLPVGGACGEPDWVSEETGAEWEGTNGWRSCPQGQFLRALRCRGDYCDDMQLMCCNPADRPAPANQVVSQVVTGDGYSCPPAFAAVGASCKGDYCDTMELTCRRYASQPDATATYQWTASFSEEGTDSGENKVESDAAFVAGLGCSGDHCDNLALNMLSSSLLRNTGECRWTEPFSEEIDEFQDVRNWAMCGASEFAAGMQCNGRYCDSVRLRCCTFSSQDWKKSLIKP